MTEPFALVFDNNKGCYGNLWQITSSFTRAEIFLNFFFFYFFSHRGEKFIIHIRDIIDTFSSILVNKLFIKLYIIKGKNG